MVRIVNAVIATSVHSNVANGRTAADSGDDGAHH